MEQLHLVGIDYTIIIAYLLLMAAISLFFGWFVKDVGGYLVGGNTIPWYISGVSNFMSMFSTFVFVGYAGIAYEHGLIAVVVFWSTVPACIFAARVMAKRWRRAELTTPIEYLEQRYNVGIRQMFSGVGLLLRFLDNAVRLYASGLFISTVTPISLAEAIWISGLLITFYTIIGGLWAVTVLDTIQFIVLFFATLILVPLSLYEAGGFTGIIEKAPENLQWFNGEKGAPLWLIAYYCLVMLKYNSLWAFIQRLYAVKDEKSSSKVAYCSAFLFFTTPFIFLLPAIAAKVIVPDLADPEQSYVTLCAMLLPAGMMGLMIAGMFSATMSALNSEFNAIAGVLTNDVYKRLFAKKSSHKTQFYFARIATISVGLVITFGALFVGNFGGAFEAHKLFNSLFAIPLSVPLIFGMLMRRPTSLGAMITVFGGAVLGLSFNIWGWFDWQTSTLLVVAYCLTSFIISGLINKDIPEKVNQFFDKIGTPLPADRIPSIDPGFKSALAKLFGLSLMIAGFFFIGVSFFTLADLSGKLALTAGTLCAGIGLYLFFMSRRLLTNR